jgi:hypothetical protein
VITTISTLKAARDRWLGAGHDPGLLNYAVCALDAATANTDVVQSLIGPRFSLRNLGSDNQQKAQIYGIFADGEFMLKYELQETPPDADVVILP